ncbi:MAG TPA: VWA domain-containing protein, partial [Vicinamibacterales bacterium]|nr:VWA domain-containing protein [Vicinamibacterales bacterium]
MKSHLLFPLAFALLVGGSVAGGQAPVPAPPTQKPPAPAPTFRSTVQVIEVDARVFDKDGRFVTGLTRDDFEVVEQGVPQQIDAIYLVGDLQTQTGGAGASPTSDAPNVGPTSGGPPSPPVAPQTWIFFFDLNHLTPGGGFDRARKAVEEFIAGRFKDGDLAGVLAGDKMVNNRLTSVRSELLDAIKQVKPRTDSHNRKLELIRDWPRLLNEDEALRIARSERDIIQRAVTRACSDDPDACVIPGFAESSVRQKGVRLATDIQRASQLTMSSLNGLAAGLARIPGPKTVVFLSDGFVVQNMETTLRSVVGQTARSGARVYAIDVRGLNRGALGGSIEQLQAEDLAGAVTKFDAVADGPNSLAIDTGGMMIRNENNIGRALTRIADDAGRYYVLAYRPANTTFDGKFRAIQVRVKRDGLRVRARRG